MYAQLQDVDDCVLDTYFAIYEDLDDEYNDDSDDDFSLALIMTALFGLI